MAEVTGNFGDQPIQLSNAATETTLQQLLQVMLAQTAKSGKQNLKDEKALRKELQALADAAKKTRDEHEKYKDSLADAAKDKEGKKARQDTVDQFKNLGKEIKNFTQGIETSIKSITQYATSLANMGSQVSNATNALSAIPAVGGILAATLGAVAKEAERQQKAFQQSTAVGATFSGGITEMINSATRMGLTFDQFSGLINRTGRDLAFLGEGSADGAKQLVKYATAMRNSGLQDDLARLGFSAEGITESLVVYGAQLKKIGYSQAQIDATLVESTGEYLKNLDAVSKLTGESRKDLEKGRMERMKDAQFRAMIQGKDEATVRSLNTMIDSLSGDQQKAFREIAATGTATSDEAKALFTTMPGLAASAMQAFNSLQTSGTYSMDQASMAHAQAQQEARERMVFLKDQALYQKGAMQSSALAAMNLGSQTTTLAQTTEAAAQAAKEAGKNDPAKMLRLQQETAEISNKASLALSDQFSKVASLMQTFYEVLNDYVIPTIKWTADNFTLAVGTLITAKIGLELFKIGLTKAFGGVIGGGASSIVSSALKMIFSAAGFKLLLAGGAIYGLFQLANDFAKGKDKQQTLRDLDTKAKEGTATEDELAARDALRASGVTASMSEAQKMARRNNLKMGEARDVLKSDLTDEEIKKEYGVSRKAFEEFVKKDGKVLIVDIAKGLGESLGGFIEQGSTGQRSAASLPGSVAVGSNNYEEFEALDTGIIEDVNAAERKRLAILEADMSLQGMIATAKRKREAEEADRAKEKARLDGTVIAQTKEEVAIKEKSGACKGYDFSSPEALFKSFRDKNMQPGASAATGSTTGSAATGTYSGTAPTGTGLGFIAEKYESAGRGSETVGWDKSGGTSYGKKQISSKAGAMTDYLKFLEKNGKGDIAKKLRDAGIESDTGSTSGKAVDVWKEVARSGALGNTENEFLRGSYDTGLKGVKDKDLAKRLESNKALQEMMYSTSVQHGGGGSASILNSVYKKGMSDEDLIKAVYAERGANGGQKHFSRSSANERSSVVNRFGREQQDVLALLKNPNAATAQSNPSIPTVTPTATAATNALTNPPATVVSGQTTPNQPGTGAPGAGGASPVNELASAIERLNSMTAQIVGYSREVAETSRLQLTAIKSAGKVY